jgi:starch synthase
MKVLYVCTELFPLLKTGGLGDVSAALPPALRDVGCDVRVLLPGFPGIRSGVNRSRLPHASPLALPDGEGPRLAHLGLTQPPSLQPATLPGMGLDAYVLDVRALFDRPGDPYLDTHGDNGIRFALLGWAAACLGHGLDPYWQPDVVHCHDWHTGLAPLYLRQLAMPGPPPAASVFTIHNLAYQGTFPRLLFSQLGLPDYLFGIDGVEFWGQVSFMKAGLQSADRITTVSPTYAREILDPEQGCGLDGLLRARSGVISGILNGVDYEVWSPSHDRVLAHPYDRDCLENKSNAKAELQRKMDLQVRPDAMVFGVVSRLTEQKGLNLVEAVADELVEMGGQLAILGAGDGPLEQAFLRAAARNPGQLAMSIGYDESLAHSIIAGSDVLMVPSRFEPCGLTQLYALRYGALPLVHRVGGLADTVVDATPQNLKAGLATGISFDEFSAQGLRSAMRRAFELHAQPAVWARVQQHAMKQRFDWHDAAAQYMHLYRSLKPSDHAKLA